MPEISNRNIHVHVNTTKNIAWFETLFITALIPLVGLWLNPQDPFFLQADFPWLVLAPLLPAVRYGFFHGFISAMSLILGIAIVWRLGMLEMQRFPAEYSLGILIISMFVGEFSDMWGRKLEQQRAVTDYQRMRLDEFTHNYHLLKVSHDRLEQRLAASNVSLREALLTLRKEMLDSDGKMVGLESVASRVLGLYASFCQLRVAALYEVKKDRLVIPAVARIGKESAVDIFDPMIRNTVSEGVLYSVRGSSTSTSAHRLLATIPIVDVTGVVWNIITVHDMPFMALQEENLMLMAVMGGYLGDIIHSGQRSGGEKDAHGIAFKREVERAIYNTRHYQLANIVLTIIFPPGKEISSEVQQMIMSNLRGLDRARVFPPGEDRAGAMFMLLPLTNMSEFDAYQNRINNIVRHNIGESLEKLGIVMTARQLRKNDKIETIYDFYADISGIGHDEIGASADPSP